MITSEARFTVNLGRVIILVHNVGEEWSQGRGRGVTRWRGHGGHEGARRHHVLGAVAGHGEPVLVVQPRQHLVQLGPGLGRARVAHRAPELGLLLGGQRRHGRGHRGGGRHRVPPVLQVPASAQVPAGVRPEAAGAGVCIITVTSIFYSILLE